MKFSTVEVVQQAGVTYRQVDHWCRRGLVDGQKRSTGRGSRREFTVDQLRRVMVLAEASRLRNAPLGELADLIEQGVIRAPNPRRSVPRPRRRVYARPA